MGLWHLNNTGTTKANLKKQLEIQLGNPIVTRKDRETLSELLATNGEPPFIHPLFYSYDDNTSFNLVSGIIQAGEDIWQKKSIIQLTGAVEQLKQVESERKGEIAGLRQEVQELKQMQQTRGSLAKSP